MALREGVAWPIRKRSFRSKIRQLGTLVGELDQMPGGGSKTAARELVQLLMEVHGTGLERMMELVFDSGEPGEAIIHKLGQDPITRNLLLLYSLHPDDLETRVLKALDAAGTRLRKSEAKSSWSAFMMERSSSGCTLPAMAADQPPKIYSPLWKKASTTWRRM